MHLRPGRLPAAQLSDGIHLRLETADDEAFVRRLFAANRAAAFAPLGLPEPVLDTLLAQQFAAQRAQYSADRTNSDWWIVERDGVAVGRLYIRHDPGFDYLVDIALLPEVQGQGIGSRLMDRMMSEAAAAGRGVRLHVDPFKPARQLYLRKGFREIGMDGPDIAMEWPIS